MRILGFSKKWNKLSFDSFTTFRFERRDADWKVGELVQVVYKPRTKNREVLGIAKIIKKDVRLIPSSTSYMEGVVVPLVTNAEAIADGFESLDAMREWLQRAYSGGLVLLMNKLTLRWGLANEEGR